MKWLRHFSGIITESEEEKNNTFKEDASFFLHEIKKNYFYLSCSNATLKNYNICYDSKTRNHILLKNRFKTFFSYDASEIKIAIIFWERFNLFEQKFLNSF